MFGSEVLMCPLERFALETRPEQATMFIDHLCAERVPDVALSGLAFLLGRRFRKEEVITTCKNGDLHTRARF